MEVSGIVPRNIGEVMRVFDSPLEGVEQQVFNAPATSTFDTFMRAMMDNVSETNEAIRASQEFQLAVAQGYSDDILGLTLAIQRANSALNFTVQVTNRLLEAYREIIRMQI